MDKINCVCYISLMENVKESLKVKEIVSLWRILTPRQGPKPFTLLTDTSWAVNTG